MTRPHVTHQDFQYQGKTYTLGHLNGFDFPYKWPNPQTGEVTVFDVRVSFDDHCYTEGIGLSDPHDPQAVVSRTRSQIRIFSPDRYELSKLLPELVKSLMDRECYFGDQNNFFTIDLSTGQKYNIYFQVFKVSSRPRLTLSIRSAYVRTQIDKLSKVNFGLILRNVRDNKATRRPR